MSYTKLFSKPPTRRDAMRRAIRWLALLIFIFMVSILALLWAARAALRPAPGDWSTTVHAGPFPIEVGVPALIQWATTPWIADRLHGHTIPSRMGPMLMHWDAHTQHLTLQCAPCIVHSSVWGGQALRTPSTRITVHREGALLSGEVVATPHPDQPTAPVSARWRAILRPAGMTMQIDIPPTPVRDAYALFAADIPEVATAQIEGTFAIRATLDLPSKKLQIVPHLEGMGVQGLGTQAWAGAQSPCSTQLPARSQSVSLRTDSLLARAVLAAEDQRFYEHPGFDLIELTKALHANQLATANEAGSNPSLRGASTLSQQVAKLLVTGGERSPVRKLRELLYAVEMEQTLGKARILGLYLDIAPWGSGVCGARAAAHAYFGKRVDQLNAAQAVWLAAMLHNPELEAMRWKSSGHINESRAQWVANNLRSVKKQQRATPRFKNTSIESTP